MLQLNFHPFPVIRTGRLELRQLTEQDADQMMFLRSDKNVMQYLDRPVTESLEEALALIQKVNDSTQTNDGITWGITLQDDPEVIGTIGFWRIVKEHHRAEIGYLLHPGFQGKGIMQEAISAALDYAFQNMNLHSIEANVNPNNTASISLLERNNFVREAYFKEDYFFNGKFIDTAIYSLLNPLHTKHSI